MAFRTRGISWLAISSMERFVRPGSTWSLPIYGTVHGAFCRRLVVPSHWRGLWRKLFFWMLVRMACQAPLASAHSDFLGGHVRAGDFGPPCQSPECKPPEAEQSREGKL
jgi:hypothetical protein